MIEGTFDIAVDTPKHHKRGLWLFKPSEGGDLQISQMQLGDFATFDFEGTCQDKDFAFDGTMEFPGLGDGEPLTYSCTGNVWGNSISAKFETSAGVIEAFGTRLSTQAGDFKSSHEYMMKAATGEFGADDNTMYSGLYADGG